MDMEPRPELTADEATRNTMAQRIVRLDALDPIIHQPTRLRLMAVLAQSQEAVRFQVLAEQLQVQTSLLSMHLTTLHRAGFIVIQKAAKGRFAVTSIDLTPAGQAAFARYRAAMCSVLGLDEGAGGPGR